MKKKTSKIACRAVLLLAVGIFIYLALIINYSLTPIDRKNTPVTVAIPTGSSFLKITKILEGAGMVKSRILFYGLVSTRHSGRRI